MPPVLQTAGHAPPPPPLCHFFPDPLDLFFSLRALQLFASGLHTDDHFFTSQEEGGSVGQPSSLAVGSVVTASMHSVGSRREGRGGSTDAAMGGRKPSKGGLFGARVNATEHARDVERMNAEVCRFVFVFCCSFFVLFLLRGDGEDDIVLVGRLFARGVEGCVRRRSSVGQFGARLRECVSSCACFLLDLCRPV